MSSSVSRSGRVRKKSTKYQTDFDNSVEPPPRPYKRPRLKLINDREGDELDSDGVMNDDFMLSNQNVGESTVNRSSIYMIEKGGKGRKVDKDGKMVVGKVHRKDKGKSRITAYMLWAKENRAQVMSRNPEMDFAECSRRLGEMWANVPMNDRIQLKRRARRWSKTHKWDTQPVPSSSKFLNKQTHQNLPALSVIKTTTTATSSTCSNRKEKYRHVEKVRIPKLKPIKSFDSVDMSRTFKKSTRAAASHSSQALAKISSNPLDIAAHMKLLGDNLSNIGRNIQDHDGHIALSGTLSVLLDSLVCSLGPLICLTTHIHGFGHRVMHIKETLHKTLDNIAYLMPGL